MHGDSDQIITIQANRKAVMTITTSQLIDILTIYPDEHLIERAFFQKALEKSSVTVKEIRAECDKLNIPWQLFLLDPAKLAATIVNIKERRRAKFDARVIASRDGNGRGISLRIADRVIALQEYAKTNVHTLNRYCDSLRHLRQSDWPAYIIEYFDIDPERLHGKAKTITLDYLINKLEEKNIRVARGVLSNKIMPKAPEIAMTYKKSSGFIVHDDRVPYLFLPSEVSELTETAGRQILTLVSLLVLVGKGDHNVYVNGDLETHYRSRQILKEAFEVAGEILLPRTVTDRLGGHHIDANTRDELASEYMLTPSALIVTLRRRGVLENDEVMQELLETVSSLGATTSFARTPKMETSVKKFCGAATANEIMRDISQGKLRSIPAQYLLFGHVDKKHFAKLKAGMRI